MIYGTCYKSPVGLLWIQADDEHLLSVELVDGEMKGIGNSITQKAEKQLKEYFRGRRKKFELPLIFVTTPFRKRVYEALLNVPYGSTVSYKDLTIMAGNRRGFQATGQAVHFNPYMIIVPCHRVINADGSIGGYGRHIDVKKQLLNMENGKEIW